ncbi:DMT family transporter [Candidatus Mycoplasma mahonii]|uniref:DMT family transporter n=1 Tax=Candidatus Mycoplasma mahonii TaxID=3004105 RepID=UPI0026EC4511|nr:DMT family transporter [Candidatus Mycoplasma mahonii]WKX02164.1 DMT family transporter [Candidatus Mycoplasma mahonii]
MLLKKDKLTGVFSATGVALCQGMEGILIQVFIFVFSSAVLANNAFGGAVMAGKELIGLIIAIAFIGPSTLVSTIKKIRSKEGLFYVLAAILGTTTGNIFFTLSIINAGPTYGVILTALYPIMSILLLKFFIRKKEPLLVWLGVFITILAGLLFLTLPAFINGSSFSLITLLGMLFGLLAAFFWAFEGVFLKLGMNMKNRVFVKNEIILTRNIFTTLTTWIFIMPILMIYGNTFLYFVEILSTWEALLIIIAVSINVVLLRYMHLDAIQKIGPKITSIIDTNNFLVPAIAAEFLQYLPNGIDGGSNGFETLPLWSFLLLVPLLIGVLIVIYFNNDANKAEILDKKME